MAKTKQVEETKQAEKFIVLKCKFNGGKNKGYAFGEKAPKSDFSEKELKTLAGYYEEV